MHSFVSVSCYFGILTKICFICINHGYLKLMTKFLLISINTIDTNEEDSRKHTNWQELAPSATPFCQSGFTLKLLSDGHSKLCVMPTTNQWTHTKSPYMHSVMMDTRLKLLEILWEVSKHDKFLYILLTILNCGYCKLYCSSIKLYVSVALKSQYMFVIGAKPFPGTQNVINKCLHCALQILFAFYAMVLI